MVKIAPSVLSADFAHLKEDIDTIYDGGKSWIHYDVMDGHFVPNISFGYSILSNVRAVTDLFIDVHLMITDPGQYLDEFIKNKQHDKPPKSRYSRRITKKYCFIKLKKSAKNI